jgi:hypothetical protein
MNIVRVPHICGSILLGSMGSAKLKLAPRGEFSAAHKRPLCIYLFVALARYRSLLAVARNRLVHSIAIGISPDHNVFKLLRIAPANL